VPGVSQTGIGADKFDPQHRVWRHQFTTASRHSPTAAPARLVQKFLNPDARMMPEMAKTLNWGEK
jgi:hypothetical protein